MIGSFLITIGFLAGSFYCGVFLLHYTIERHVLSILEKITFGIILGSAIFSLILFALALIVSIEFVVMVVFGLSVAPVLLIKKWRLYIKMFDRRLFIYLVYLMVWAAGFLWLFWQTHLLPQGNYFYTSPSTFGDLPFHLSIITNFAYGDNFPPVNPLAPSNRLSYHFVVDFISSILLAATDDFRFSLIIPGIILGTLSVGAITLFVYRLSISWTAALFAPALFFFNGGIGFVKFIDDIIHFGTNLPHERYAHIPQWGVEYPNILAEILMAERALLLGIPLGISVLFFLYLWLFNKRKMILVFVGLGFGLLMYVNVYGYLTIGFVVFLLMLLDLVRQGFWSTLKRWWQFVAVAFVISLPFLLWISPQVVNHDSFLRISPGEWPPLSSTTHKLLFWITNFGVTPILAIIALIRRNIVTGVNRILLGLLLLTTTMAHILIFQPYAWDNNRFVLYTYLAMAILAAIFLATIVRGKTISTRLGGLGLFMGAITSGILVSFHDPQVRYPLYTKGDFAFARFVRDNTDPRGIFLTSRSHNNPVVSLAGRRVLLGYEGYLWTHGITQTDDLIQARAVIYEGVGEVDMLVERHLIRYIVVSPSEQNEFAAIANAYLAQKYKTIYNDGVTQIFDTAGL